MSTPFFRCLRAADAREKDVIMGGEITQAFEFWLAEIPRLSQREQSLLFFELQGQLEQSISHNTVHEELQEFIAAPGKKEEHSPC